MGRRASKVTELPTGSAPDRMELTDLGNASRFVARHAGSVRYVEGLGWHVWDGARWTLDATRHVERLAHDTVRHLATEVAQLDGERWRQAMAHAIQSANATRLRAMLDTARSHPDVHALAEHLDAHPALLNVENGILNVQTGELSRHDPRDLMSKLAPVPYDPTATAPTWEKFLRWAFLDREPLIEFVQRAIGYCLTAETREHAFFLLHGGGANGKSTFLNAIESVLGDYSVRIGANALLGGRDQEVGLAAAAGARLAIAVEPETGRAFRDGILKTVTGERTFTVRRLYQMPVTLPITFKIVIASNHLPAVRDGSDGFWRRVRLIPFENQVRDSERNPYLGEQLQAERDGILAWAVRGAMNYFEKGLGTAPEVDAATRSYREEEDTIRRFVEDRCALGPDAWVKTGALYGEFVAWSQANGEHRPPSRREFRTRVLRVEGVRENDRAYGRGLAGIQLKGEAGDTSDGR